jgi:SRSO17 transposase
MTPEEISDLRPRLEAFIAPMLADFPRADQREKGELYVRGLMTDGRRKSMQPMAGRLGVDHQRLQQFISSSNWDYTPVRANIATWAASTFPIKGWVVDDTGFPKDAASKASPGVARQYCGALGKVTNCQVGVSVHLACDTASAAANWRLFLPESWDPDRIEDPRTAAEVRARRTRCGIGEGFGHREKWKLALDMIDEMAGEWGLPPVPIVFDAGFGDITAFRQALHDRDLTYVAAVKATTSAHPADALPVQPVYAGKGPHPRPTYPDKPSSLKELAIAAGRSAGRFVTWRHGTRADKDNPTAAMRSRFLTLRVRPANRDIPRGTDGSLPECWLLVEWPPGAAEPSDYWLSNLPVDTPLKVLVGLAKLRWRVEHDYRELKTGLGLDHFEGRNFTGWHRHVTLACLAQAFCTEVRLDPKVPAQD